jgi:glycosyltransferase EpsF
MKNKRPIRVLQIIDSLGMGGAETWLMELLRLWSKTGCCRMDFLATSGNPGIFDEEARQLGAQIHYVRYRRADLPRFAKEFRRMLREGQYDAVHDHQDYASGWHFLMGAGVLPAVRVTHVHNPWLHIEANYAIDPLRRLTATTGKHLVHHLATHVCGTSQEILRRYGFDPMQPTQPAVSAVHCGFDVGKFNKSRESDRTSVLREFYWPEDSQLVLFVGRLDRALEFDHPQNHKNSWFAVNVVQAAVERQPSVRFLMAGAGDRSRHELESHIEQWGLKDKLCLIGIRNDIPRLMRAADVLFFPSRQEGLGMAAVEAQAACLPVLASTAVPSECVVIPELYCALPLSEPIDKWADTLIETMTKPRLAQEVCLRAFESSAFSIVNSARRLNEIYSSATR